MSKTRQWLDSVRLNPDHSLKSPLELFNPQIFVRLSSISLYLRGTAASVFGLVQDEPFHLVPAPPVGPQAEPAKSEAPPEGDQPQPAPKKHAPPETQPATPEYEKAFEHFLKKAEEYDKKMGTGNGK